jgi:hypothetical protein
MNNYQVDQAKWSQLSITSQMANIGSEVGRALTAKRQHQNERLNAALDRAIDLFSATAIGLAAKKSPQLKEVLRAKEEFLGLFFPDPTIPSTPEVIEKYFHQFALAARRTS